MLLETASASAVIASVRGALQSRENAKDLSSFTANYKQERERGLVASALTIVKGQRVGNTKQLGLDQSRESICHTPRSLVGFQ